jgi:ATP citrate (pro-S)-lyase
LGHANKSRLNQQISFINICLFKAVQGMLDFDHVCRRSDPSVVAMIYPFTGDHQQKFYWGHEEILIPCYKNMSDCMKQHRDADVLINFASLRSAYESTIETMKYPQVNKKRFLRFLFVL